MVLFKTLVREKEEGQEVREIKVRKVIKEVIREQENIDDNRFVKEKLIRIVL